jgi:type II secretory ATPase GspE/PulE/Tfp pilus assembly ATPase PilB-like protein
MSTMMVEAAEPEILERPADEVVHTLLDRAIEMRASDLFFAANAGEVAVQARHLGLLRPLLHLPAALGHRCIAHIKAFAGMEISEHRRPLDGRWVHERDGQTIDLRVNTIPTLHGEDCCVRLLSRDVQWRTLNELGLIQKEMNDLLGMLNCPGGLILVTGPTGSGKTTTVYACLRYLNNGERKINTIEDPIEYGIDGIRQSQVNPRIGLDFGELLRSVLRQAPDVIVIGEIRDAETAATAVHAANSGHLVLATLHAPLAASAVESMRAWGIAPYFLGASLGGIITQRLVRTLCPLCRVPCPPLPDPKIFRDVEPWLDAETPPVLYTANGCPACHQTGYADRTGVFEVLPVSHQVRMLISAGSSTEMIREQAIREGLVELRRAALLKVARGETTAQEIVRTIPSEDLGLDE